MRRCRYAPNSFASNLINDVISARESLRLSFHDAVGYSQSGLLNGGGADGSLIIFSDTELTYRGNSGMDDPVYALKPFLTRHSVSAGDLIQFAGAVGLTNCPGAPRLEFYAGRPNATIPASDGSIPSPGGTPDAILARVQDVGISPAELVHLLASHSVAYADHVDTTKKHIPLDSTPNQFDTQFFLEVLLKGKGFPANGSGNPFESSSALYAEGEMRLQSDFALSRDSRTACTWQEMISKHHIFPSFILSLLRRPLTPFRNRQPGFNDEQLPEGDGQSCGNRAGQV